MTTFDARAIIFDLEGVLVDSSALVEKSWRRWARRHDLDPEHVLRVAHGRRAVDVIGDVAPSLDAEEEARRIARNEATHTEGLRTFDGAGRLVDSLPAHRWAVATSGTRSTALTRLKFASLPTPQVLVTAEDIELGKPEPEVYLHAASQLDESPAQCVAVEDSPAGLRAARGAGMQVVAVTTPHSAEELSEASALVPSVAALRAEHTEKGLLIRVLPGTK